MNTEKISLSIIVPCYNEAPAIKGVISGLYAVLNRYLSVPFEVIVVDDGSNDGTTEVLASLGNLKGFAVCSHPYNKGYGAAVKSGVKEARYDWLAFYDADGQHTPESLISLLPFLGEYDMVVGARQGYKGPAIRQPGKMALQWIANYLSNVKIPDINSGLRLVRKDIFLPFRDLPVYRFRKTQYQSYLP